MSKKKISATDKQEKSSSEVFLKSFSDSIHSSNGTRIRFKQLGEKFAAIESYFFTYLSEYNIPTSFQRQSDETTLQLSVQQRLPFTVRVLNNADTVIAKVFDVEEGFSLKVPITEFYVESHPDLPISESHIVSFDVCSVNQLKLMNRICSKINAVLKFYFERRSALLTEVILQFGLHGDKVLLYGDLTPLSMKVISKENGRSQMNPYLMDTTKDVKKYTEYLYKLTNS